jgi:stage II sporulation protein AB (anti-sigma F factor)
MYNEIKTSFLAKIENVMVSRTIAMGFLVDLNLPVHLMNEIKTVISEAVTNAIIHGYLSNESKYVEMNLAYDEKNIYMDIQDKGVGIANVEEAREPLYTTKVDEERAGLGFTIMEVFTDEMKIESSVGSGTKVHLVKHYGTDHRETV